MRILFVLCACVTSVTTLSGAAQPDDQLVLLKRLSLEELMLLDVTTVLRRSERITDAPAAISVITAEDIRRSGLSSLADIIRLADGMTVTRFNGGSWGISTRGFTSTANNKLLVLVDGRSVYTQLFGGVFWETQDYFLNDIDRIEVIRGPAGTLWGPNAVNGVINIITKRAADTQGGFLRFESGSREPAYGSIRYGDALGTGFYRLYAKSSRFASPQLQSGESADENRSSHQAGFRIDFGNSSRGTTLQGDVSSGRFGLADRPDADYWNANLLLRWRGQLRGTSSAEVQAYIDSGHRQVPRQSWETRTIQDVSGQHNVHLSARHQVTWGGGFRATYDKTRPGVLFFEPRDRNIFQGNVFGQDDIALPGRMFLTLGTRIERTTFSGVEAQPSVRLRRTGPRVSLWGAASRAVRTPTRFDQDLRIQVGPVVAIRGDRSFRSESLLAYEAGAKTSPVEHVSMEGTVFVHDYANLRSQEPSLPAGFPIILRNLYEGNTRGLEIAANYEPYRFWLLHAAYTKQKVDLKPGSGSLDTTGAVAEAEDPAYFFTFRSYLDLPGNVELDGFVRAMGELRGGRTPAYQEIDLRLGWQPTASVTLSLIGRDLVHARHTELKGGAAQPRFFQREALGRVTWAF